MAKLLTREDEIKKEYSELVKLNQKLKLISSGYYISHSRRIYLKSLVNFTEVLVELRYPKKFKYFRGAMILPNQFFEFTKKAKKTKLTIQKKEKDGTTIYQFEQEDNSELFYDLNIVNPEWDKDEEYIQLNIIPQMYKRYFGINSVNGYVIYKDNNEYHPLTEDEVSKLIDAEPVYLDFNGVKLLLTKHLILDLKKDDKLGIARYGYKPINGKTKRGIYTLEHETDLYVTYILFNNLEY